MQTNKSILKVMALVMPWQGNAVHDVKHDFLFVLIFIVRAEDPAPRVSSKERNYSTRARNVL